MTLEFVSCYLCGSDVNEPWASENGHQLVRCVRCQLLFVNPRPAPDVIAAAHLQGVHAGDELLDTTGGFSRSVLPHYERVLNDLLPGHEFHADGALWLDIGCGHGEFLATLEKRFGGAIRGLGSEPNTRKRAAARRRGLDVRHIDLDNHDERYDFISLLNVYSHLPNPVVEISKWRELLRPNGALIVQTGDVGTLSARLLPRPLLLPDHLSFVTESQLTQVLDLCGFEVTQVVKYPILSWSAKTLIKEAAKLLAPGYRSRLLDVAKLRRYEELDMFVLAKVAS